MVETTRRSFFGTTVVIAVIQEEYVKLRVPIFAAALF